MTCQPLRWVLMYPKIPFALKPSPPSRNSALEIWGELITRHHAPSDPPAEASGAIGLRNRDHRVGCGQRHVQDGGVVGDAVDALAEGAVGAAQALTDQVAVLLKLFRPARTASRPSGPTRTRPASVTCQPLVVRTDVPEDPLRPVDSRPSRNRPLAICVN